MHLLTALETYFLGRVVKTSVGSVEATQEIARLRGILEQK